MNDGFLCLQRLGAECGQEPLDFLTVLDGVSFPCNALVGPTKADEISFGEMLEAFLLRRKHVCVHESAKTGNLLDLKKKEQCSEHSPVPA